MTIQISNFHVSDKSRVAGSGRVAILPRRKDAVHTGVFGVKIEVVFDPAVNDYPTGSVRIDVDLSDSFKGAADSTLIEQVNTFGKHTPTAVVTGRCRVSLQESGTAPVGCRFWLLIANNKKKGEEGTPMSSASWSMTATETGSPTAPDLSRAISTFPRSVY